MTDQIELNKVKNEVLDQINAVENAIDVVLAFQESLIETFSTSKIEIKNTIANIYRDIPSLKELYRFIRGKINKQDINYFNLSDIFLDNEVAPLLRMYQPYLSSYEENAIQIGNVMRTHSIMFTKACDEARLKHKLNPLASLDSGLYTIFYSLFTFEMLLNRYMKCFQPDDPEYTKAKEASSNVSRILSASNNNDKKDFFKTQKEINLLRNMKYQPKVNSRFITKGEVRIKREEQVRQRFLVLFNDCLFITNCTNVSTGECTVLQELSITGMKVTESNIDDNTLPTQQQIDPNNDNYYILLVESSETYVIMEFFSKEQLNNWKTKLLENIELMKPSNLNGNIDDIDITNWLGKKSPICQSPDMTHQCNGQSCRELLSIKSFVNCRADGLLYCNDCCNKRITLKYDNKNIQSRVCDLCFIILTNETDCEREKNALKKVFALKKHDGIMTGWLEVKLYNNKKNNKKKYLYCVLLEDAIINIYNKCEDKWHEDIIMLPGMKICQDQTCTKHDKLKPHKFCIEHCDNKRHYIFTCVSKEVCKEWKEKIEDVLENYLKR